MRHNRVLLSCAVLFFAGICIMDAGPLRESMSRRNNTRFSSASLLADEFRTVFANLLWIKADQYHHEFIQRNPNWTQNKEQIGLLKMIVALDPHFVEAYAIGSYIYSGGFKNDRRALSFVNEGVRANPRAWELHHIAAMIHARRLGDPTAAIACARRSIAYCDDEFYKKREQRLLKSLVEMEQQTRHPAPQK